MRADPTSVISEATEITRLISWRFLAFDAFTPHQLYEVLQLRSAVFVIEQACLFQDMDGADGKAMHLLGSLSGRLIAYARVFGPGLKFSEASIGRVITHESVRGSGAGHVLLRRAIACLSQQWGPQPIRIGAQARLEQFYLQHDFVRTGVPYMEDGIPHIDMLRPA